MTFFSVHEMKNTCIFTYFNYLATIHFLGFPGSSDGKESAYNEGDLGLIPGSGRSPGGENGNPLKYSCLESPMNRGAWWAQYIGAERLGSESD